MRQGRSDIRNGSLFLNKYPKGPNSTSYRPNVNSNTRSFSMGKKLVGGESKWQKKVPGPGNYEYPSLTDQNSQKSISKYLSAQSNKFGYS